MDARAGSLLRFDRERSGGGRLRLAGVDEAGRGSWAGPVVAAAVVLPDGWCPPELDDSKRLSPARRERLFTEITGAAAWAACAVSPAEIDHLDILRATLAAMARAVARLPRPLCRTHPHPRRSALLERKRGHAGARGTMPGQHGDIARNLPVYRVQKPRCVGINARRLPAIAEQPAAHPLHVRRAILKANGRKPLRLNATGDQCLYHSRRPRRR